MNEPHFDNEFADVEVAVLLQPIDAEAKALVKQKFSDQEILESNAFTGTDVITLILPFAKDLLAKVAEFLEGHDKKYAGRGSKNRAQ